MPNTPEFPDLLRLIEERTTAFCAAVAAAPDLDTPVPSCPEWTLYDLVQHLGRGRRYWAATIAAGPSDTPQPKPALKPPRERAALLTWMTESTQQMVDALRAAGPDRGCWAWWDSPRTAHAAARHQVQEIAVHTYDAQLTVGAPQNLPDEIAIDGVDEFLFTCVATTSPWPHEPATVEYHATEGHTWRLHLNAAGANTTRPTATGTEADVTLTGPAQDLVLAFYCRIPTDALAVQGNPRIIDQLIAWDPDA